MSTQSGQPTTENQVQTMSDAARLDVMHRFFELANRHDVDHLLELVHHDYVGESDVLPEPVRGPDAYAALLRAYYAAFPDAHYEIEQMLAADAYVVTRLRVTGTHRGAFMGHPGNGRRFAVRLCHVDDVRDGKIVRAWYYWDTASMLRQLDIGPADRPAVRDAERVQLALERDAIRAADAALVAALNGRDVERWLRGFDPDAWLMPPGAPPVCGTDAIRAFVSELVAIPDFRVAHHLERIDVARSGDLGWVSYSYELTIRDAAGNAVIDKGKDVSVYRKAVDGAWQVVVDMWSANEPSPEA
jgi:steroid delta-isomerase-like uncharacterized protein